MLLFDRKLGRVGLVRRNEKGEAYLVGVWAAHNRVAKSRVVWPKGDYKWTHYNAHPESGLGPGCHPQTYGCFGIHVFDVPGRSGMGVHAGRTFGEHDKTGWNTLGCIRVPVSAMTEINDVHRNDPLTRIHVEDDLVTRLSDKSRAI